MSFPCTGCGACCRRVGKIMDTIAEASDQNSQLYFPYKWDETGKCEMLLPDNSCSVYENRPLICNVDKLHSLFAIPKAEYYALTIGLCNQMMDDDGLPERFRIK